MTVWLMTVMIIPNIITTHNASNDATHTNKTQAKCWSYKIYIYIYIDLYTQIYIYIYIFIHTRIYIYIYISYIFHMYIYHFMSPSAGPPRHLGCHCGRRAGAEVCNNKTGMWTTKTSNVWTYAIGFHMIYIYDIPMLIIPPDDFE